MARATPIGCSRGDAIDILFEHQSLLDKLPCRRGDRLDIGLGVRIALEDRSSRIARRTTLFGGLGERDVAAREFVHGAVAKVAGSEVPAAIGTEWCCHHRRPDAGSVIAVLVNRR